MMCQHVLGMSYLDFLNRIQLNTIHQSIVAVIEYGMTLSVFLAQYNTSILAWYHENIFRYH